MVDAEPEPREFVEIANNTDRPIDLSGLRLLTERGSSSVLNWKSGRLFVLGNWSLFTHDSEALARDRLLESLVFDAYRFRFLIG